MSPYDVFVPGETMDLCCASEEAIHEDGWHSWFNDAKTTRYLEQGLFPNTPGDQVKYLNEVLEAKSRLIVLIRPKGLGRVIGVASLSSINFPQRQAEMAMVIGNRSEKLQHKSLIALEAKCRLTEHAFEVLGMERINSSMALELRQWHHWQVLLGDRFEGIGRKRFRKGYKTSDVIYSSCLLEDYLALKEERNGSLWPGVKRMGELMKLLPKEAFSAKMERIMNDEWDKYYRSISLV